MLIDHLENYKKQIALHPLFDAAFQYLRSIKTAELVEGKIEIKGDDLFAIIASPGTLIDENPKLEAHKVYIDIHYIIEGTELFGWKSISECDQPIDSFNDEKDYILYDNKDFSTIKLTKGSFVIVFPEDAHAPGIETTNLKKVVLKIKI